MDKWHAEPRRGGSSLPLFSCAITRSKNSTAGEAATGWPFAVETRGPLPLQDTGLRNAYRLKFPCLGAISAVRPCVVLRAIPERFMDSKYRWSRSLLSSGRWVNLIPLPNDG